MKTVKSVMLVFLLFFLAGCANQEGSDQRNEQADVSQTDQILPEVSFHEAAFNGNLKAVQQYIEAGSNLNQKDASGASPLIVAATFGKTEVAGALIDAGADINFQNKDGGTPLHAAAFFCHQEIVESLLAKGTDKTIKNNSGATALASVAGSFDEVKGVYDYFVGAFAPMGVELDLERIKRTRPEIAAMLR